MMGEGPMGYHFDQLGYDQVVEDNYENVKRGLTRREILKNRIAAHDRSAEKAARELERLESMPDEPTNEPAILYFEKVFGDGSGSPHSKRHGKRYTYVAVKAGDGKWYTSGPRSPKGYTWEELCEFLNTGVDEVWLVSELIPLEGSS
jgi:hypothetical protein